MRVSDSKRLKMCDNSATLVGVICFIKFYLSFWNDFLERQREIVVVEKISAKNNEIDFSEEESPSESFVGNVNGCSEGSRKITIIDLIK